MQSAARANDGDGSFRLIYRSRNRILGDRRRVELADVFSVARSNNKRRDICGALLISGDWFCQVLEGAEPAVQSLFERIQLDGRHERITVLQAGQVDHRVFSRWAMARVSAEGEPDIPLIAHVDGIAPAAGRGTTSEQEEVLDVMRDAVRSGAHQSLSNTVTEQHSR